MVLRTAYRSGDYGSGDAEMNSLEVIVELTRAFLNGKVTAMSGRSADELQKAKLTPARQIFPKALDLHAVLRAVQYDCSASPDFATRRCLT